MEDKNNRFLSKKGFTLVEVIIAIFIITVGIVSVSFLVTKTISFSTLSTKKLIAAHLAQEGIEIVRNIRDTNWVEEAFNWYDDLPLGTYGADYQTIALPDANCDSEGYLEFNGNFYVCTSDSTAFFQRKITISDPIELDGQGDFDRMTVKVEVIWEDKGNSYQITTQEDLYNWQPT